MSERSDSPALPRRDFLKTTGVVIVGFSLAGKVRAQTRAARAAAVQRGLVSGPPDPAQVDSYIAITPTTATLIAGA
jgi:hypothetical protein